MATGRPSSPASFLRRWLVWYFLALYLFFLALGVVAWVQRESLPVEGDALPPWQPWQLLVYPLVPAAAFWAWYCLVVRVRRARANTSPQTPCDGTGRMTTLCITGGGRATKP